MTVESPKRGSVITGAIQLRASQRPIFIVGPSRSGTTLMSGCLNANPDIFIAGETHFFDDLAPRLARSGGAELNESDRKRCEDYFLALTHRSYGEAGDPERGWLQRSTLRELAGRLGADPTAHFEAFCRLQAEKRGGTRWGEKTPRHVFRIADIMAAYPHAQFICMIRDPRAVVASYRDFKKVTVTEVEGDPGRREALEAEQRRVRMSYHVVVASLMWKAVAGATLQARQRAGPEQIWVQRYEDLVGRPETALRALCEWLSVEYAPSMVSTVPIGTSSFQAFQSDAGLTTAAVERWRQKLDPAEIAVVQSCCRVHMADFGYEPSESGASLIAVIRLWSSLPAAVLKAFWANRTRFGGVFGYVWRRARAAFS